MQWTKKIYFKIVQKTAEITNPVAIYAELCSIKDEESLLNANYLDTSICNEDKCKEKFVYAGSNKSYCWNAPFLPSASFKANEAEKVNFVEELKKLYDSKYVPTRIDKDDLEAGITETYKDLVLDNRTDDYQDVKPSLEEEIKAAAISGEATTSSGIPVTEDEGKDLELEVDSKSDQIDEAGKEEKPKIINRPNLEKLKFMVDEFSLKDPMQTKSLIIYTQTKKTATASKSKKVKFISD